MLIARPQLAMALQHALKHFRAVALLGARQVGKTTLVRIFEQKAKVARHFDLERPADLQALSTPELTLGELHGIVVLDEVQRRPDLFSVLRPLLDRDPLPARFILLGSASPDLAHGVSESLAGRCRFIRVPGLSLPEVGPAKLSQLWSRGGFPESFIAPSDQVSMEWREAFLQTFIERDLPRLGLRTPSETLRRFWLMLAHYHGQTWNASAIGRNMDMPYKAVQHVRDVLAGAYMIRVLPPWFENLGKRLVRSPKVYLTDSGLLHALFGLGDMAQIRSSPIYGASWEGFALEQTLIALGEQDAYFYGTQAGAELDLMLIRAGKRWGFEYKCTDAPKMTKSLSTAIADLRLEHAWIVYPGSQRYPLSDHAEALPLTDVPHLASRIKPR